MKNQDLLTAIPAEDAKPSSRGCEAEAATASEARRVARVSRGDPSCVKPGLPRPAKSAGLAMTASARSLIY